MLQLTLNVLKPIIPVKATPGDKGIVIIKFPALSITAFIKIAALLFKPIMRVPSVREQIAPFFRTELIPNSLNPVRIFNPFALSFFSPPLAHIRSQHARLSLEVQAPHAGREARAGRANRTRECSTGSTAHIHSTDQTRAGPPKKSAECARLALRCRLTRARCRRRGTTACKCGSRRTAKQARQIPQLVSSHTSERKGSRKRKQARSFGFGVNPSQIDMCESGDDSDELEEGSDHFP